MWIEAVEALLERLGAAGSYAPRIRCISVSGQQHGLVALAADGTLARSRAKLWNDFSTAEECRILTEAIGGPDEMIAEVGNSQRTGYTAPKILHLRRHEPRLYDRARTLLVVHNYINWYLTGGPDGGVAVMEPGDTSGTALWHPGKKRWSQRLIEAVDPALTDKLPPVRPADRTIGKIGATLSARFGLPPDCRVDAGSGDNMYGALGTGNIEPGMITVSLGTSGTACTVLDEPFIDPTGEIAAYCDSTGRYLPLLCVSNMANGYNAVLEQFGLSHAEFDAVVEKTPPGNGGRVMIPWYEGERTPDLPLAAPISLGFGLGDFVPEKLCRAVLEGHVLNLYEGFTRMPVEPHEIRLTGGLASSASWCRMIADVFEAETVPVRGEGAALGAAIHAAWVWHREAGRERSLAEIAQDLVVVDEARRQTPQPGLSQAYRLLKRLFRALSRRARGLDGEDPFELRRELRDLGTSQTGH
jgi:xylulokinase